MKHSLLRTLMAVLVMAWGLPSAWTGVHTVAEASAAKDPVGQGVFRIVSERPSYTGRRVYVNTDGKLLIRSYSGDLPDDRDLFVFHKMGDGLYAIQSLMTGKFVLKQDAVGVSLPFGDAPFIFTVSAVSGQPFVYNILQDSKLSWHYQVNGSTVVRWDKADAGSNWHFERVTKYTDQQVQEKLSSLTGFVVPTMDEGHYYRIFSLPYNRVINYDYVNEKLFAEELQADSYLNTWEVVGNTTDGTVTLKNAVTEQYLQAMGRSNLSSYYGMGDAMGSGFKLVSASSNPYLPVFTICDNPTSVGLHSGQNQGYAIVQWYSDSEPNKWLFREISIDQAKLAEQRQAYQDAVNVVANVEATSEKLLNYYTDKACTVLKDEYQRMTDEELTAAMTTDGLPQGIISFTLKIKNSSWKNYASGTNWEKKFRIQDYKAYSEPINWASEMGMSHSFGTLNNPTGITAKEGDVIYIMVGNANPEYTSLEAELVPLYSREGRRITLKPGLNIVLNRGENNIFIRYVANNYRTRTPLSQFANIPIHIEGGTVNGYFDLTAGDTNDTWVTMQADGLASGQSFDMRTEYVVAHVKTAELKQFTPVKLKDLMEVWNWIVDREEYYMGFRKDYTGLMNCVLNAVVVNSGYMYASTGGSYYNANTSDPVFNADKMIKKDGTLWGPAHEFGHNHQRLINMAGMTEVSNNTFSNMIMFEGGRVNSRGELWSYDNIDGLQVVNEPQHSTRSYADKFSKGFRWFEHDYWGGTQWYWKLFLYYHAAGNDNQFLQKLFRVMRDKPMSIYQNRTGLEDNLRFALGCCEAANEDLSSFFEAIGFFRVVDNVPVADYSTSYITITQDMIDTVKEKMHTYPKRGSNNLIFISDHVAPTPATYEGHVEGEMRANFNRYIGPGSNTNMGDYGSWEQFKPENAGPAAVKVNDGYPMLNEDGTASYSYTALNNNVVGYKIYDQNGNLLYFANTATFSVPRAIVQQAGGMTNLVVKVCSSNGDEVRAEDSVTGIQQTLATLPEYVDVYSITGQRVRTHVSSRQAVNGLSQGVYVINGKKVLVK